MQETGLSARVLYKVLLSMNLFETGYCPGTSRVLNGGDEVSTERALWYTRVRPAWAARM